MHRLWISVVNRVDSQILKTQWVMDQLQFLTWIPDWAFLMFEPWVLNEIWITDLSSALIGMLMSSSKLFLFFERSSINSGARLLLELYCVVVIKHVTFFTIWAKLTMAFTCTSLPFNHYTFVFGCGCGFGFEQKFWQIDGFGEKRKAWISGFAYPYSPPLSTVIYYIYHPKIFRIVSRLHSSK